MRTAVMLGAVVLALTTASAHAETDDLADRSLVFARGNTLIKTDAKGKTETELATLPSTDKVRALRIDALGKVLLIDVGGSWSWLPLDGSTKTPNPLPCDAGPAQLAEDGLSVLCRAKSDANATGGSIVVTLATGKVISVDVPPTTSRMTGIGIERRLVWADASAVWAAPAGAVKKAVKVAPAAPLRSFSVSPDGSHALGVFASEVFENARKKVAGETLMVFALDGEAAQRKAIQKGVPVEWSHDSRWVLIQDGASACIMLVVGGEYKCWKGYTAASISPDGKYALILGNRDGSKKQDKKDDKKSSKKGDKKSKKKKAPDPEPVSDEGEPGEDEGEGDESTATDDVAVAPPSGQLALYRAQLDGAFAKSPALVMRVVDGAAVWIP
ncbi:MAG: hypothetical protein HOV81_14555 [Kofleriaceae bacterium]|nr:hypothetical protein [Kofleriaceae bacterium]